MEDVRHHLRLSKSDFAEKLGVSPSYYSQILNGKKGLSHQKRTALFELYHVNLTWLSTGEGEMFIREKPPNGSHAALSDQVASYETENPPAPPAPPASHASMLAIIDRQSRQVSDLLEENARLREEISILKKKK